MIISAMSFVVILVIVVVALIIVVPFFYKDQKNGIIEDYTGYKAGSMIGNGLYKDNTVQWMMRGVSSKSNLKISIDDDIPIGNFTDKSTIFALEAFFIAMKSATSTMNASIVKSWLSINIMIPAPLGDGTDTQIALYFSAYTKTKIYTIALITFMSWSSTIGIHHGTGSGTEASTVANGPKFYFNTWYNVKCVIAGTNKFYMKFDDVVYKNTGNANFTSIEDSNIARLGMNTMHVSVGNRISRNNIASIGSVYLGMISASWAM